MLPVPVLIFGCVLALLYGAAFHLWRGGSTKRLFLFLVLSLLGFWIGDALAWQLGWSFAVVGILNVGTGTLGSVLFLLAGNYISHALGLRSGNAS